MRSPLLLFIESYEVGEMAAVMAAQTDQFWSLAYDMEVELMFRATRMRPFLTADKPDWFGL